MSAPSDSGDQCSFTPETWSLFNEFRSRGIDGCVIVCLDHWQPWPCESDGAVNPYDVPALSGNRAGA